MGSHSSYRAGPIHVHVARHGTILGGFGGGQPVLAVEVVFAATLLADLLWSSSAALFILFGTYFGITAVGRLIHWRHNAHAERLLGATLAGAATSARVTCYGDPVELVRLLPIPHDLAEPVVALKGFLKLRGWRIVAWLVVMFAASIYIALFQPIGSYWLSNAVSAAVVLAMIPVAMARLSPTYYRVAPGRLDILRYHFLSTKPCELEKIPLRHAEVTARFDKSRVVIRQPDETETQLDLEGILDHDHFVRALLCAATCDRPTPPLPDDTLYG